MNILFPDSGIYYIRIPASVRQSVRRTDGNDTSNSVIARGFIIDISVSPLAEIELVSVCGHTETSKHFVIARGFIPKQSRDCKDKIDSSANNNGGLAMTRLGIAPGEAEGFATTMQAQPAVVIRLKNT